MHVWVTKSQTHDWVTNSFFFLYNFFQPRYPVLFIYLFSIIFISWRLITLQYCSGFCHTLTWISHGFICVPHPESPSLSLHAYMYWTTVDLQYYISFRYIAKRFNQSILKKVSPEYSLEGLMLKLKLKYFDHLMP